MTHDRVLREGARGNGATAGETSGLGAPPPRPAGRARKRGRAATSWRGSELRLQRAVRPERGGGCQDPAEPGRSLRAAGKAAPAASGRAATTCQERDSNPRSSALTSARCVPQSAPGTSGRVLAGAEAALPGPPYVPHVPVAAEPAPVGARVPLGAGRPRPRGERCVPHTLPRASRDPPAGPRAAGAACGTPGTRRVQGPVVGPGGGMGGGRGGCVSM